jgi:hypothetical protein
VLELGQAAMLFFAGGRLAVGLRAQGPGLLGEFVAPLRQGGLPPRALQLLGGSAGLVSVARFRRPQGGLGLREPGDEAVALLPQKGGQPARLLSPFP